MKVLALDYGSARTGVAVSDPTGTLARPVATVARVDETSGFDELVALVRGEEPELVVVGLPLTLRGEHGQQARATAAFVERLRAVLEIRVELWDERFTSVLAGGRAPVVQLSRVAKRTFLILALALGVAGCGNASSAPTTTTPPPPPKPF